MKGKMFKSMCIAPLLLASTVYASGPLNSDTQNPAGTSESWFGQMSKWFDATTEETTTTISTFDSADNYETEKVADSSFRAKLINTPETGEISSAKYIELSSQDNLLDEIGDKSKSVIGTLRGYTTTSK